MQQHQDNLSHEFYGEGEPLFLIPGHQANKFSWRDFWKPLTSNFRITLLDNRGIGLSPSSESPYSVLDMAQDVVKLMDFHRIDKASFFGHSMGGAVVQEIAYRFPHRVRKIILASSFAKFPTHASYQVKALEELKTLGVPREQMILLSLPWLFGETFLNSPDKVANELVVRTNNPYPLTQKSFALQTQALFAFNSRPWLQHLHVPCLILHGSEDLYVPSCYSEELRQKIPFAKLIAIKAGHGLHVEDPETLLQEVRSFFH